MTTDHCKTCHIELPRAVPEAEYHSLADALTDIEPVLGFQRNGSLLSVDYAFPDLSFADIWAITGGHISHSAFSPHLKWRYRLKAFLESNEQDHLLEQFGWQKYITDIYVTHHNLGRQAPGKKKLWQNYRQENGSET